VTGLALLAALVLFTIACGSSSDKRAQPADRPTAATGTAQRAVLDFWRYFQVSSWPTLAAAYDPSVLETLGSGDLMNAISLAGGSLQTAQVRKVDAVPSTLGTLVTLTLRNAGKDETVSFLLRRRNSEWRIMYDSLLAGILPTYVQSEVAARAGEPGRKPSQETVNAGNEAARIYRQIFVPAPHGGRVFDRVVRGQRSDARERSPSPEPQNAQPTPQG
jgi:hypothetical protein